MGDPEAAKRRYPRYRTGTDVTVWQGSAQISSRITQISRGGCLVFPSLPPQASPEVRVSFRLSQDVPAINCKGEIVYNVKDRGTGIAFTEISQYQQEIITSYFDNQLAAGKSERI